MKAIDKDVESVLNAWFGEELDNQENGLHHKKHLYEPLSEIVLKLKSQNRDYKIQIEDFHNSELWG